MVSVQYKRTVGTFSNRKAAEHALNKLKSAGFSVEKISVSIREVDREDRLINRDLSELPGGALYDSLHSPRLANALQFADIQERTAPCATITGSMLGAIGGCLAGIGLLAVPGVGALVVVGTSGTALGATLAGAGIGAIAGSLISALTGSGISEDQIQVYGDRPLLGDIRVMIHGTDEDARRAESILKR